MPQKDSERWMEDVRASQRNIVFPDTVQNEASGWRKLITSKRPLTLVQIIGLGLLYLAVGAVFWDSLRWNLLGKWAVLLIAFGISFLILRWRVRVALRPPKPPR